MTVQCQYDFSGKVVLITDGIGLAAAKMFVVAGAKVLVVGRNVERGAGPLTGNCPSTVPPTHNVWLHHSPRPA